MVAMELWRQSLFGMPMWLPGILIPLSGSIVFLGLLARRWAVLRKAAPDQPLDQLWLRLRRLWSLGLPQQRQTRYPGTGIPHLCIFFPFLLTMPHLIALVLRGIPALCEPQGAAWTFYSRLCDVAATVIFFGCVAALVYRLWLHPGRFNKERQFQGVLILAIVSALVWSDAAFQAASHVYATGSPWPFTLAGVIATPMDEAGAGFQARFGLSAWLVHELLFFGFLCIVPGCKQFHEITGLANVFCGRLRPGKLKPLRYGLTEQQMAELDEAGVRRFTDFTWKHVLDFYSCADCGRCTDQCPAVAAGRALSPREFTCKGQQLAFADGTSALPYTAEEIWSCTGCGACEQECPLGIEYIDKILELRRAGVEDGEIPLGVARAFESLEQHGNPWGRAASAAWPRGSTQEARIASAAAPSPMPVLFFPDSFIAFDERAQGIADAVCGLLTAAGKRFAITPQPGIDSGHEARRFGEEFLFMKLRDLHMQAIRDSGAELIVTADPHALNGFRHDYDGLPRTVHITEVLAEALETGALQLKPEGSGRAHVFHDPCYLGRHNGIYEAPRRILRAIPGLKLKEMKKQCERSFCCGGPLSFFHESQEDRRPAEMRIEQAAEAGAEVIVTACPWCMVNLGEAAKSVGSAIEVIDIASLALRYL